MPLLITNRKNRKQNGQLLKVTKMLASQHNELNRKQSGQLLKTVTTMLASQHIQKKKKKKKKNSTKSRNNTRTTALERSVEYTTGGFKALLQLTNFTLGPDAILNTETHKNSVRIKAPNSVNASNRKHTNQINHYNKQRRVLMANSTVCQSKWKPIVEPRRAKRQAPTHWLKFYEEAVIESEARTAVVQLKSEA